MTVRWFGDKLRAIIQDQSEIAYNEIAKELAERARAKAPMGKTYKLRRSIYHASRLENTFIDAPEHGKMPEIPKGGAVVGAPIFYARFVEFGTPKAAAHPFFRPALDEVRKKFADKVGKEVNKKLR